jgi:hypothetical protein
MPRVCATNVICAAFKTSSADLKSPSAFVSVLKYAIHVFDIDSPGVILFEFVSNAACQPVRPATIAMKNPLTMLDEAARSKGFFASIDNFRLGLVSDSQEGNVALGRRSDALMTPNVRAKRATTACGLARAEDDATH